MPVVGAIVHQQLAPRGEARLADLARSSRILIDAMRFAQMHLQRMRGLAAECTSMRGAVHYGASLQMTQRVLEHLNRGGLSQMFRRFPHSSKKHTWSLR